ncbi:UDP-2,3-diacylglucosamine diphosphatase [Nitratifractor sp.]
MAKTEKPRNRETEQSSPPSHLLTFSPSHLDSALIQEGALFVADAHYPHHGDEFLRLLKALDAGRIETPQLFLMGDIFDLLFGCGEYIRSFVSEAIELLNGLSRRIDIYYLEGNHDFCLKSIFPNINILSRGEQPLSMRLGTQRVMLSHGDRYDAGWGYEIFTFFLRSCRGMCLFLPWQKPLIDRPMSKLRGKKICRKIPAFEKKVERIVSRYPQQVDLIVEGHFHQGRKIGRYLALPALACQKELGVVQEGAIRFVTLDALLER